MWYLGPIAFVHPWMLTALAALPAIWWLLRAIPPAPQMRLFPAIRLLQGLRETEQSPEHTPWWLLALRLLLAAFIILGLSRPLLNPSAGGKAGSLLIMVIDDGWASGPQWPARRAVMDDMLAEAERHQREVVLLSTARAETTAAPPQITTATAARAIAASLLPKPWRLDRAAAAQNLSSMPLTTAQRSAITSVWLSDGLASKADLSGAHELSETLRRLGPVSVLRDPPSTPVVALQGPRATSDGLELRVLRADASAPYAAEVYALGENRNIIATAPVKFAASETSADVRLTVPAGVRNAITQLRIAGVQSAASVWLLDERWKQRTVGIVSGAGSEAAQPLLDDLFYLDRAMNPFADIRKGTIGALVSAPLSILVLADIGRIVGGDKALVEDWLEKGGLLVRFAGPHMVEQSDDLIPVQLRQGGRELGGALSWDVPATLAPFPETSPFFGLAVPGEVTVSRQILAQPDAELLGKTWASLEDGTPLVTASRRGKGWIVLFHVTANMRWSNLPASGLYVGMLQRITSLAQGAGEAGANSQHRQTPLSAIVLLDGQGQLRSPMDSLHSYVATDAMPDTGPHLPPGYYGDATLRVALNLNRDADDLHRLPEQPGTQNLDYGPRAETEAGPWLLCGALILWLADGVIALALLGRLPAWAGWRPVSRTAAGLFLVFLVTSFPVGSRAQEEIATTDDPAPDAALETRLAYVITGDAVVDTMSAAGLAGLSKVLRDRTAFEAAAPMGVNPEHDELVFFPLIYWPMTVKQQMLSEKALSAIDAYMKNGGTIFFDTRDQLTEFNLGHNGAGDPGPGQAVLREILKSLDVPPLAPVSDEHVLTRSYYLLRDFPGRHAGGKLWVADASAGIAEKTAGDGISAIVIGANDWASAWAIDDSGVPLLPVDPGGEPQRERAYRTGVNLVMYSLTGNYKADQVHVPVLLERLGQ
jgi:hypothetical protein